MTASESLEALSHTKVAFDERVARLADAMIEQRTDPATGRFTPLEGFKVKDSGERRVFDSGMVRDTDAGKTRYDLVFDGPLFERLAVHLTKGAAKYSPRNWMQAAGKEEANRFKESAIRHFFQWMRGDMDEDHFSATIFNMNGFEYLEDKRANKEKMDAS